MNILVIGANGFIGSNLCQSLIQSGQSVVGLVRESSDLAFLKGLGRLQIVKGDITAKESLTAAMQDIAVVYNVAGLVSDWGPWEIFQRVNVDGVRNVMESARQQGIRRVVHLSSVSVYGFPGGSAIDEIHELILGRSNNPLQGLVSGSLDLDKIEYLTRDAHFCGVPYGEVDVARLLDSLRLLDDPETGRREVGVAVRGIAA